MVHILIVGSLIGLVAGALLIFLVAMVIVQGTRHRTKWGINLDPVKCPHCGHEQTRCPRWPTSFRQAMWGGWTCKNCGCEIDKWGNKLA